MRGKPNIWTLAVRQQQYQIDVRSVEELFGHQEDAGTGARGTASHAGTSNRISRSRSFKESTKEEVNIIILHNQMSKSFFLNLETCQRSQQQLCTYMPERNLIAAIL